MTRGMNVTSVDTNVTVTGLMPGQNYLVSVQSFNSENETGFIVGDTEVQTSKFYSLRLLKCKRFRHVLMQKKSS